MLDYMSYKKKKEAYKKEEAEWEKAMLNLAMACKSHGFLPVVCSEGTYKFWEQIHGISSFYPDPYIDENILCFKEGYPNGGDIVVSIAGQDNSGRTNGFMSVFLKDLIRKDCAQYILNLYQEELRKA